MDFVDLATQQANIKSELDRRIAEVLAHGQYIMGPEVGELERRLEQYTGAAHCITVSSGTEALLISLMTLGVGRGDEVITTPFSFAATVEVIALLGATPIFVDIEHDTCNIDPGKIEAHITQRTKAIMPVSLYGQPASFDEINAIAEQHGGISVIEDAAQSFGATYKGKKSCNLSHIGCTSFFPSKPLGCYGDGGAIFTNDDNMAQTMREIRVHGQSRRYYHTRVGVGGRMDTLQCAITLAKLTKFDFEIARRIEVGCHYNDLADQLGVSRVHQRSDRNSVFAQYTIFSESREKLQKQLASAGIPSAVHYPIPLNEQPAFRHFGRANATPIARNVAATVLSVPMHPYLTDNDQTLVMRAATP